MIIINCIHVNCVLVACERAPTRLINCAIKKRAPTTAIEILTVDARELQVTIANVNIEIK